MTEKTVVHLTDEQFAVLQQQEKERTALAHETMLAAIRQSDTLTASQIETPKMRDLFAMAALHGLAAAEISHERLAKICYDIADAMMLARSADRRTEESEQ